MRTAGVLSLMSSVNYSKFDSIVDSDDEDDTSLRAGRAPASLDQMTKSMPPHLYRKLTEAQMAAASGDHAAALRAQQELSEELERGPPEFRDAFRKAQSLRVAGAQSGRGGDGDRPRASSKATGELTPQQVRAQLQAAQSQHSATLSQLERAERMGEDPNSDPEEMARFLHEVAGLTPDIVHYTVHYMVRYMVLTSCIK